MRPALSRLATEAIARRASATGPIEGAFVLAPASLSWLLLLAFAAAQLPLMLCVGGQAGPVAAFRPYFSALAGQVRPGWLAAEWLLMVGAMMLPLAAPMVRHVAARSFPSRRWRGAALFLVGFVAAWLAAAGLATLPLLAARAALAAQGLSPWAGTLGCLAAAGWQLTPAKRVALKRCHGTVPLHAFGREADADALRFGFLHGGRCIAACWAPMFLPMAGQPGPGALLLVFALLVWERGLRDPPMLRSAAALVLLAALLAPIGG